MFLKRAFILVFCMSCFSGLFAAAFEINQKGSEDIVDYSKYGEFSGVGTDKYQYKVKDSAGLKQAVGEGIYPNFADVLKDPAYKKAKKAGKLEGSQWDFVNNDNHQLNFFKWATVQDDPGIKLYYEGLALEHSGNLIQAIKAYYAIIVHFPKAAGMTFWGTIWYVGPVAVDRVRFLMKEHPELDMHLENTYIRVLNSFDTRKGNDVYLINPGKIVQGAPEPAPKEDFEKLDIIKIVGKGRVKLAKFSNKHWQLYVDGKPYFIRGMAYSPNKVGLTPDKQTLNPSRDWMFADYNNNGLIDGPYDAFVDTRHDNKQDKDYKPVGDFKLMKEMGVNTLRLYHHGGFNNDLLMEGYKKFGYMYLMGDFIGMYCTGSGAEWYYGTDYTNPEQKANMLKSVREMVEEYRDKPYILMWVLGNENNYGAPGIPGKSAGSGCRAKIQPEAYYEFVNEAAKLIHSLDPEQRPVAVCNGDLLYLDICAAKAPELDVFGCNAYRGDQGFGNLFWDVKNTFDKPVLVTEYGCSAYAKNWDQTRAETGQADYMRSNTEDLENNLAGMGEGNALGGIVFEWVDEWWKAGADFSPSVHCTVGSFGAPFLDGWSYEEWFGLCSQGDGTLSPFLRQMRPAYTEIQKLWRKNK